MGVSVNGKPPLSKSGTAGSIPATPAKIFYYMAEEQSHEEQLGKVRNELKKFLGRVTPTPEDRQEAETIINSLTKFKTSGEQATIPLVVTPVNFEGNETLDYRTMTRVKAKVEQFPKIEEEPLVNNSGGKRGVVVEVATRLGLLPPRTSPDNYVYISNRPEYSTGLEESIVRVVYNCFEIKGPNLPKHTYWHEVFAGDAFRSYMDAVVITVNKSFSPTNTLLGKLGQRLTNR